LKSLILGGALVALALPVCATAASPFDGTWKTNPASITTEGKPITYLLAQGVFTCVSCTPSYKVKADGAPQTYLQPQGFIDTLSVKVVDDHTLDTIGAKGGVKKGEQTWTISPDGKTLTEQFVGEPAKPGAPVNESTNVLTRVASGPAGSHLISGSWRLKSVAAMSQTSATRTFKVSGDAIDWASGDGVLSYHAMAGGKAAPIKGDPAGQTAVVTKVGAHKIIETDWRGGKKTEVDTYTVSPDGKTMTIVEHFLESGRTTTETATKL
jgi:hypothetical protein